MLVEIDLVELTREDLNINEYLTIVKAYNNLNDKEDIPFVSDEKSIRNLISNKWFIEDEGNNLKLSKKSIKLVGDEVINFDEIFDIYPNRTPDGRMLRASNKEFRGRMTADYKKLRDKYLTKVKNKELHGIVKDATKIMISDYIRRGSLNFLPLMETFINQNQWERYFDEKPGETIGNIERL